MEPGMHRVSNPGSKARGGPGALAVGKLQGQARWGHAGGGPAVLQAGCSDAGMGSPSRPQPHFGVRTPAP